jgi:hypothetical protein
MKMFLPFIIATFLCCNSKGPKIESVAVPPADTILYISSGVDHSTFDTCKTDSLKHVIDSLSRKLFVSDYKIQRVKYYLGIAIKNPSQTKFLKGWINRAIK